MRISCIAFDCFGTVFDMSGIDKAEIKAYVEHVNRSDFSPYKFPDSWYEIPLHPDAAEGVDRLQKAGYFCATLSNATKELTERVSARGGIHWDHVIDLAKCHVYKPHFEAYKTIRSLLRFEPEETLMVTANPTFGDIEGAKAIGMQSQVIRHGYPNTIIELAEMLQC